MLTSGVGVKQVLWYVGYMPYRITPLVNDNYYHIYNRGVEKRTVFSDKHDFDRFLQVLDYYQFAGPKPAFSNRLCLKENDFSLNPKIVEIVCYCFMPNHFHILIRQLKDGGISEFIRKVTNSYTKYFNTKNHRVGPLFQGAFKAVIIENDVQFIHVSRYIHLNPYTSELVQEVGSYPYSSYPHFIGTGSSKICVAEPILSQFKSNEDYKRSLKALPENEFSSSAYKEFVEGHADYARELEYMKHLLIEGE